MRTKSSIFVAISLLLLSLMAWGREDRLSNRGLAPAAAGTVITNNDKNGNTEVEVKVEHMAAPQALTPAANAYVVWVQPRGESPQNMGVLRVNSDLKASLKTTIPAKVFDVFITAEQSENPTMPSASEILRGSVERQ